MFDDIFCYSKFKFLFVMDLDGRYLDSKIFIYRVDGVHENYDIVVVHKCTVNDVRDRDKKIKYIEVDQSTNLTNSSSNSAIYRQLVTVYPPNWADEKISSIESDFIKRLNLSNTKSMSEYGLSLHVNKIFNNVLDDHG